MHIGTDTKETLTQVVTALRAQGGMFIDGHGDGIVRRQATVVALQTRLDKHGQPLGANVVMLCENTPYYCINPLELQDDGQVLLSPCSVGGTVTRADELSLDEQIAKYNIDHGTANPIFRAQLSDMIRI